MDMMTIPNYVYLKHVLNDMKYQILQQYILVIFMTGEKPILTEKVKYYMDSYFSSRVMNAPVKSDVIPKLKSSNGQKQQKTQEPKKSSNMIDDIIIEKII